MRILHIIDAAVGAEVVEACALALSLRGHEQRVCVLGGSDAPSVPARAGVPVHFHVLCGPGPAVLSRRRLRRATSGWRPEVVHAWDRRALWLATSAEPTGGVVAAADGLWPIGPAARFLPDPDRTVLLGPVGDAERPRDPAGPSRAVHVPPAVRRAVVAASERAHARRALRLAEGEVAVLLLGGAPHADAMRFVFLLGLLREAGCAATGLVPADAAQIGRAERFHRSTTEPRFVVSRRTRAELLAAVDVAVFVAGGPGPTACWEPAPAAAWTPVAAAHAAGVPAVAPAWAMTAELYCEASAGLCLAHNATLPELARVLLPLVEDPGRRRKAAGLVADHLAEQDPGAAFLRGVEEAWALAGGAAVPAAEPVGAGA